MAHLLAASALVHPASLLKGTEADGEAFNVTDGKDEEFWYDVWLVVRILRNGKLEGVAKDLGIHTVPVCVMCLLVWVMKWVLLVFTLGFKEPSRLLSTNGCSWATEEHTLDDTKAKTVLRYNSMIGDRDKEWLRAVTYEEDRREWMDGKEAKYKRRKACLQKRK